MTVIVLTKNKNTYTMTGDGRTSRDWMGIATDNSIKVHEGKGCIYGGCGNASAKLIMKNALNKTCDPFKLLKLLNSKDYKDLLQPTSVLVATKKYGAFTVSVSRSGILSTSFSVDVITWDDCALPQIIGSGFLQVSALLSIYTDPTPKEVEDAVLQAYKTNHTIGGKITQVSISKESSRGKKNG